MRRGWILGAGFAAGMAVVCSCGAAGPERDLAAAIEATPVDGVLELEPGTYVVAEPILVDQPLRIVGHPEGTTVRLSFGSDLETGERIGLRFIAGQVGLEDVNLVAGTKHDTLVHVDADRFDASDVSFEGGRVGLWVGGATQGVISTSSYGNSLFGAIVASSDFTLEENRFEGHQEGIVFDASSKGVARRNQISGSGNGILVQTEAAPVIVGNTLTGNGAGIAFYESGGGTAEANTIHDNGTGVDVRSGTPVAVLGNYFAGNQIALHVWVRGGAGELSGNACTDNERDIVLAGWTAPEVMDNSCDVDEEAPVGPEPEPVATTTTITVTTTVATVAGWIQEQFNALYAQSTPAPGVTGPSQVACPDTGPVAVGDVFVCDVLPQTEPGLGLESGSLVVYVLSPTGRAAYLGATDNPGSTEQLMERYRSAPKGMLCRDLLDSELNENGALFPFVAYGTTPATGYFWSLVYWSLEGEPERMDADLNGIPCETLYAADVVAQVLEGGPVH